MSDEPQKDPDEIKGILSDLDNILSGLGQIPPIPQEPLAPKPPAQIISNMPPPSPAPSVPPEPIAVKPPEPPALTPQKITPAAQAPQAAEVVKPVVPIESPIVPAPVEEIPAGTPKDQIRRVAYIYTFACTEARNIFGTFLSQAARTISKKPLYLRQVMSVEISTSSDPEATYGRALEAKASVLLAVVDNWPQAKIDGLGEACARGGILFRSIAPGDVQKKSTAVDVLVDMMLLPGEM